jgi:transcriptional regulator
MYVPPHFAEERLDVLQGAIRRTGLANLVTVGPEGLLASPLPLMIDPNDGEFGTLHGHLAKANPQWRHAPATDALAIFMGPDAYVSPSWYATKQDTHKVVPTWNYITVHASGPVTFFEDATALLDVVTRLTERHETGRTAPWAVSDAPAPFIASQLKGIVGFRMPIRVLQGKWKMSQNRPPADRAGVVAGMRADGVAVAEIVAGLGS